MDGPAQTLNYMIAGYAVIFGISLAYVASLVIRWRRLQREQQSLSEILEEE
jgi:hypothetical protein